MQKIVIRNFGPITEAEIELKKSVVLIGEQASGKSTIAKLIYYFKSLREDLFNQIYNQSLESISFKLDYVQSLVSPSREKFYDFFGSTSHMRDFDITFYYNVEQNKSLHLTLTKGKKLHPKFSDEFHLRELSEQIRGIRNLLPEHVNEKNISEVLVFNQEKIKYAERLSNLFKDVFCCKQDDNLFIVAGRNATVGYSDSFEKQFLIDTQIQYEKSYKKKQQTIDETLMLDFMDRVVNIKGLFKKFGDFNSYLNITDSTRKAELKTVIGKIDEILKGKYQIDAFGEKIVFDADTNEQVYLSNASSGQQEVIRILQDIFFTMAQNKNVLRIVEEPEAHLFPLAQKRVIELLVQMAKQNENNQLIITTHSPYVLTVFNNLLFAQRVIDKNPDSEKKVSQIIGKESRLACSDFSAYVLRDNKGRMLAESIVDAATGMIDQNYLDTVSEILSNEFNNLYRIHAEKFQRK
ncbi:MAG: ATP-binding protein [Tannerellaceae bacterium]|jgi:predicted ATPase|nr:ATP-binding protein [Tannerellaceae bacterium]